MSASSTHYLITGGAGFVGSSLALALRKDHPTAKITALDNLKRRGSELTLRRLADGGVDFLHGDIRSPEDLEAAGPFEVMIECSAEPSVHAGYGGSPAYLLNTNLVGTINCLEQARKHKASIVFLSTSRVYPIASLRELPLETHGDRLRVVPGAKGTGWSEKGIDEDFPLNGSRSLYGTTKLASELLIEEYRALYGMKAIVNRCGVLTGPWQMGKVDQGVVVLWAARHLFGGKLSYMGFGGHGTQVRDMLHVDDLYDLLALQLANLDRHDGQVYNVGGGMEVSASLRELTDACRRLSGCRLDIGQVPETRGADMPWYVTDCSRIEAQTGWRPKRGLDAILTDIFQWLNDHRAQLEPILSL